MFFDELETDRSYLDDPEAVFFDAAPWQVSQNRFEYRMAANLRVGTTLSGIDRRTLVSILATATSSRRQGLTVDIECVDGTDQGRFNVEVVGVYDFYIAPRQADAAANIDLALRRVSQSRPEFFLSVIPEARFWLHSEQALGEAELDWASIWSITRKS